MYTFYKYYAEHVINALYKITMKEVVALYMGKNTHFE